MASSQDDGQQRALTLPAASPFSSEIQVSLHNQSSFSSDSPLPGRILALLSRSFPGSFDEETAGDCVLLQKAWLFSIYDPAICSFAVAAGADGQVVGFAAAAVFAPSHRMNLFNLVRTRSIVAQYEFFLACNTHPFCVQCVESYSRRSGIAKRLAGCAAALHVNRSRTPSIVCISRHFTACLASHALKEGALEVRGRSDAGNTMLRDMYEGVGCLKVQSGFGSSSSSDDCIAGTHIEWSINISDLLQAVSHAPSLHPAACNAVAT